MLLLLLLLALTGFTRALHSGAPSLACTSLRPFHGLNSAKPASSSQFFLSQSTLNWTPNESVQVNITTHSNERHFRGFLVQAYEPSSGKPTGSFQPTDNSRPLDCSAATHRDATNKQHVTLTWLPPTEKELQQQQSRQVRFRGTIVATYEEFYTGFESSHLSYDKFGFAN